LSKLEERDYEGSGQGSFRRSAKGGGSDKLRTKHSPRPERGQRKDKVKENFDLHHDKKKKTRTKGVKGGKTGVRPGGHFSLHFVRGGGGNGFGEEEKKGGLYDRRLVCTHEGRRRENRAAAESLEG